MLPIRIRGLSKHFGATAAVDAVDLDIDAGEMFFLLGPSGCGKTTLLRMLAGFVEPTAGSIQFGERDVTRTPPNKRPTAMVFQGYALWPHMSVRQNVAFGLEVQGKRRAEVRKRVEMVLDAVQLLPMADRKPQQLSGGQQQRVALARALAVEPAVLLLDEPLANLDAQLRVELRGLVKDLCRRTRTTAVYVTHDQAEALSVADRIAVMSAGRIAQAGPPRELYQRPRSRFVASFLGQANFLTAVVAEIEPGRLLRLRTPAGEIRAANHVRSTDSRGGISVGARVTCCIRPESARPRPVTESARQGVLRGVCAGSTYLGHATESRLDLGDGSWLTATVVGNSWSPAAGEAATVEIDPDDVIILEEGSGPSVGGDS
ncbi:MAG: ABC transporter ATP-binding protein [Phycisphaeraceae bacterium]|nr:ABC transporter ATP-binding protein [Phycisphaeraceae bacterium]